MTEDEAFEKLDILLEVLRSQKDAIDFNRILVLLRKINPEFNGKWLKMALYKLNRDKFIEAELFSDAPNVNSIWLLSIEGTIYHGYAKQKLIDNEKKRIIAENESRKSKNDCRLILGTWFAGIAALLLLGWQIWLWNYPLYKDFHNRTIVEKKQPTKDTVLVKMIK